MASIPRDRSVPGRLRRVRQSLGPAMARVATLEGARAGIGAAIGLGLASLFLVPNADLRLALAMIAPFGASAVLIFAVPNSPLAQPWSAVVGNTVSALAAVAVVKLVPVAGVAVPLAAGLAILAMALTRSLHPPGGAVALTVALNPEAVSEAGFRFALAPVALGTATLALVSFFYTRSTGRKYPFRQPTETNAHGTTDRPSLERIGLDENELRQLLTDFRQTTNVGVEDLARLIAGAKLRLAGHHLDGLTCADIMSRDLVTVPPDASRAEVGAIFSAHAFTSLPVVEADGTYLGTIFQIHLIRDTEAATARELMATDLPAARPGLPAGALLPLLAAGEVDAVPVLDGPALVGIATRTDLIAAMAQRLATTRPG
ncbi:MAG TPA: HPP family protein [Amaricoccus sp.]|jgi:CBS domain-containing membrane protein|nr:HPP family protein [Amaricoccus sp.]